MFYTVYKTTNNINGKFYIGKHQTIDLEDDYIGSGKHLIRSVNKYGTENFQKEILFIFDNEKEMNDKEAEIVTAEFVKESDNYNLCVGGQGGFSFVNASKLNIYGSNGTTPNIGDNFKRGIETRKILRDTDKVWCDKVFDNMSSGIKKHYVENGSHWTGKKHTDASKKKIGIANSISQKGDKNSQYGSMWIYSIIEKKCKKISKGEEIPEGWYKGRKFKF